MTKVRPMLWRLPGPPPPEVEKGLDDPRRDLRLEVPEQWCYRIDRPAPSGGWTRRQRDLLRPSLFPLGLERLWWDEEQGEDRNWRIWALERAHLDTTLGSWGAKVWAPGRKVRVHPIGHSGTNPGLGYFPNLAPLSHRLRRWPVATLRRVGWWGIPMVAILTVACIGAIRDLREGRRLDLEAARLQKRVASLQTDLDGSKGLAAALSRLGQPKGDPSWVRDLDGLTRLLPEDSRVVDLVWKPAGIRIDLITPHPELIREALEASPEFRNVRFVGNLERREAHSRLTLECESEGAR